MLQLRCVFSGFTLLLSCVTSIAGWGLWRVSLREGDTPYDGRVFVNTDRRRPMCDQDISPSVAKVICRQLGWPPTNVTLKNPRYTGNWSNWLQCTGEETNLLAHCHFSLWRQDICPPEESMGISCNGGIRLSGNDSITESGGNIILYDEDQVNLTGICDHHLDHRVAEVICRQLGFDMTDVFVRLTAASYYGPGYTGSYSLSCHGNETSHAQCQRIPVPGGYCDEFNIIGVDCNATEITVTLDDSYDVDMPSSVYITQGYNGGVWAEPVHTDLGLQATVIASVICYQQGFSRYGANYTRGEETVALGRPFFLTSTMRCTYLEDNLSECPMVTDPEAESPSQTLRVTEILINCKGIVRLMSDYRKSDMEGVIQIENPVTGKWSMLALPSYLDQTLAVVACHQLGFNGSHSQLQYVDVPYSSTDTDIAIIEFLCSGQEVNIRDCVWTYDSKTFNKPYNAPYVLYINCLGVFWTPAHEYRVDKRNTNTNIVYIYSEWVYFSDNDYVGMTCSTGPLKRLNLTASVMCRNMGYSRYGAYFKEGEPLDSTSFDYNIYGSAKFNVYKMKCHGAEDHLSQCPFDNSTDVGTCDGNTALHCHRLSTWRGKYSVARKRIKCLDYLCRSSKCPAGVQNSGANSMCSRSNGGGCVRSYYYDRAMKFATYTGYCMPECRTAYLVDGLHVRQETCCYEDDCNYLIPTNATDVYKTVRLVERPSGLGYPEGLVELLDTVLYQTWLPVKDTPDIPDHLITYLCEQSGYTHSNSSRMPSRIEPVQKPRACMTSADKYATCIDGNINSCLSTTENCSSSQKLLRINCNAIPPPMRLLDGTSGRIGRVELLYNDTWGTICGTGIGHLVAKVICRTLGYSRGWSADPSTRMTTKRFLPGTGHIHFSKIKCSGEEPSILQCDLQLADSTNCTHEHDLAVICELDHATARLGFSSSSNVSIEDYVDYDNWTDPHIDYYYAQDTPYYTDDYLDNTTLWTNTTNGTEGSGTRPISEKTCLIGMCSTAHCYGKTTDLPQRTCVSTFVCYIDKNEFTGANQPILYTMGCTGDCVTGRSVTDLATVTRYCCTQDKCRELGKDDTPEVFDLVDNGSPTTDLPCINVVYLVSLMYLYVTIAFV